MNAVIASGARAMGHNKYADQFLSQVVYAFLRIDINCKVHVLTCPPHLWCYSSLSGNNSDDSALFAATQSLLANHFVLQGELDKAHTANQLTRQIADRHIAKGEIFKDNVNFAVLNCRSIQTALELGTLYAIEQFTGLLLPRPNTIRQCLYKG
jgi:hypothetical protein